MSAARAANPVLADGDAYLDGAVGTQVSQAAIDAIADAFRAGIGNAGGAFPASHRLDVGDLRHGPKIDASRSVMLDIRVILMDVPPGKTRWSREERRAPALPRRPTRSLIGNSMQVPCVSRHAVGDP